MRCNDCGKYREYGEICCDVNTDWLEEQMEIEERLREQFLKDLNAVKQKLEEIKHDK
jgi:hypothetical protein